MSNRDSLGFGELLPQDVVDIFAQEKHSKRGRKKRSRSLGQALGWLKGKKKKDLDAKGKRLGLGPALDLALDGHPAGHQGGHKGGLKSARQTHSQAVPKRDDDDKTPAPPLLQENVFIEASRPQYLENLHSEALEGLKMMQQEETNNGMEFQDNESVISTMTVHTDGEGGGFTTDSTIADTSSVVSVQSSVSTRSSRSGLTRQESTFRPLNSGKKSEKTKTRRRHRKTVAGIPQHVQRELGLDRAGWSLTQRLDEEQHYNGENDNSTTDGPQQGTSASLQNMNSNLPLNKDQLKQLGDHAGHRDDLALLHRLGPDFSGGQRPQSLAVPWMTTANSLQQEPPSPVMSMSPQAAYMSKIIPNAVLPPSIEVLEISRGRSRNSVRTVSKSSLLLSSPSPSRASSRASSSRTTSSRSSNVTSASRYNPRNMSDSSCWSNSESSETLVSDSSTISRSTTPRQRRSQEGDATAKEDTISVHSSISKVSKRTSNGKLIIKGEGVKNEGPFVRSLSVMKSKRAPPPPSRSYSLHNKMKRRSRDLTEIRVNAGESSLPNLSASGEENENNKSGYSPVPSRTIDSPGYTADTSSLDDSTGSASFSPIRAQLQTLKAEETAKEKVSKDASQEKQKLLQENKLSKIISPSSGYSSQDGASSQVSKQPHKRGILATLQRFFPGSTSAASTTSPPLQDLKPDTVDTVNVSPSVRALRELFNIPPPPKVHAPPAPPPEVWAHSKRSFELLLGPPAPDNLYAIIKKNPKDRRQQRQSPSASTESSVKSLVIERKHKTPAVMVESVNRSLNVLETKKVQESGIVSAEIHKENRLAEQNVDMKGNSKVTEKVRVSDIINVMLVRAVQKREGRLEAVTEEEEAKKTSTQTSEVKTLPAISLARILPSSATSVVVSPESSWPPPPPPLAQAGLNGPDEIDFPLPPPPMFSEAALVIPVQVPPERSIPGSDSSFSTTSVISVVKTERVRVNTEIEPQTLSPSQGTAPPPLSIPPPPAYTAPPPPVKAVSPPTTKKVSPPPPPKEVTPPPPPKEVSPPPPPPLPKEVSPPLPIEVTPPPPPKEVTPPPPPKEVSPVRPKEFSPPLVQEAPPPLVKDVSVTLVAVVSPSPVKEISPQPPTEVSTLSPEEASFPSTQENACQSSEEVSKLTPPQSMPPPPILLSQQEIEPPQDSIPFESEPSPVSSCSILTPPQSTPPPPPVPLLLQPQVEPQNTGSPATQEPPPSQPSEVSIPQALENSPCPEKAQEPAPSAPGNIPLPVQGLANIKDPSSPTSTEKQAPELTSDPVEKEEPAPIFTPSPNSSPETPEAQKQPEAEVTMRNQQPSNPVPTSSASGEAPQKPIRRSLIIISPTSPPPASPLPASPPPTSPPPASPLPVSPLPASPPPASPPPTSPPAVVTAQPALPKSQSVLVVPASSSTTVVSPTKKSPPAMTFSPSMNLQEAIRLRTAARSKAGPPARLSLNAPISPVDLRKSPSCTASFIFSKSNKKVVIETKPAPETLATVEKKLEVSSVTKGVKVPPPVAKKPKTKGKGDETSEGTEQTAGQEALQESIMDAAEKTNGTAGTVELGGTPST
ncbi:NHS-like protein 3 isoform X2 [Cebidichthys violaceus]|uniref:NHS-like protein 3 isoform X2 n=1 Tax=Cebidichthys violaceus TaxID=271503 RepID=UPI0035CBE0AF